jgi:hypothetical protein
MQGVAQAADPQTMAATRLAQWVSHGAVSPSEADISMARLLLLVLLPQISGVIVMIARSNLR